MSKYSVEQVVRGINFFASEHLCEPFDLSLDEPLHCHLAAFESQEICPLMFLDDLASYFGFILSEDRAMGWLKLAKKTQSQNRLCRESKRLPETPRTGRDLVDLIIRKSECPDFSARNLFGHRCESAGCFLGVSQIVQSRKRFAPSTPIRQVLTDGQYQQLVARLSWILGTNNTSRIFARPTCWIDPFCSTVFWIAFIGLVAICFAKLAVPIPLKLAAVPTIATILWIACNWISNRYKHWTNLEMACGIHTFRDLSEQILVIRTT